MKTFVFAAFSATALLFSALSAAAETVTFGITSTVDSVSGFDGEFTVTYGVGGPSISAYDITTEAGLMSTFDMVLEVPGYTYADGESGSTGNFADFGLIFRADDVIETDFDFFESLLFAVDGFDADEALAALAIVSGGTNYASVFETVECFSCNPSRLGLARITAAGRGPVDVIPLPASGVLLIGALGALAIGRRKRR